MFLCHTGAQRARVALAIGLFLVACGGGGGGGGPVPVPLEADFALDTTTGRAPLAVAFQDLSRGPVTSWSWDLGDGTLSDERAPVHSYADEGRYDVRLTVRAGDAEHTLVRPGLVVVERPLANALEYGMNPSFARWSGREIVFADAMMRASEFLLVRGGELTLEPAPLVPFDAQPPRASPGWPDFGALAPGDSAGAWLFGPMEGTLPDGRVQPWILTWEGGGQCSLIGSAVLRNERISARRQHVFVDSEVGRGNGTVALWIELSSRTDPVRNVRVWLPGTFATKPLFWPPYLDKVRAMNGGDGPHTWRALDWNAVNEYGTADPLNSFRFDLAGVIRPSSPSQGTRRGMAPEFQAAFANELGCALHFQVPHRTDDLTRDEYELFLRDTFTRLRDGAPAVDGIAGGRALAGLDPARPLTLELSNELWNSVFPAQRWMAREAGRRGLTLHEAIAQELLLVWRVADEVFGDTRVVQRYVGGWMAEPDFARRILAALPPGTRVDALGCAAYVRPTPEAIAVWTSGASGGACPNCPTPEGVLAAAWDSLPRLRAGLRAHRALADRWTNPDGSQPALALYECGQSFDALGAAWGEPARAAQTLPGLYALLVDGLVPLCIEEGVELMNWYSFMTDQDPDNGVSVGFGLWNDMHQSITLPVPDVYLDEGAPKAAAVYRGPPQR